ncbi:MAG: SDR family oxidoreductase [Candidatus Thalassarchaeaceae archaeon]|jgi:NAD(P)-dependent dehydrogenase (short-subunit alcohol dehydrogenase family)|nr:SDR family oxidoreductase [Candidatus Thalassarchaeaceae archaeon]|tara:strand:- start:704 stop:1462 length:759 start_codon:yes stop_codon:yes gene_type:complete
MNHGVVLVTGGSKRIGREICIRLSRNGYNVIIHYRNSSKEAEETARIINSDGGNAIVCQADLSEISSARNLISKAIEEFGYIDAIVNNASVFLHDDISTVSSNSWDKHMQINAKVPLMLIKEMYGSLDEGRQGNVVNILDQKLHNPNPDYLSYTTSKYAMLGLTDTLARSLAPKVRVNAVSPGHTLASDLQTNEGFQRAQSSSPLGYGPDPEDIADAVCYLMGAKSVTGQVIYVDSGERFLSRTRDVVFETE